MMAFEIEIGDNALVLGMALIPAISSAIAAIVTYRRTKELKPNGGASMRDQVEQLHRVVVATDRADDAPEPKVIIDKKNGP